MSPDSLHTLDQQHLWHPFTQMQDWCAPGAENLLLVRGEGATLWDDQGRSYLDGNSSIWTNLHGHAHPALNAALRAQAEKLAHSSFLGQTNAMAPRLAEELLRWFAGGPECAPSTHRVFLSDDGSTAIEAGLKMMHQARLQRGEPERTQFLSLGAAYHGDTVGAMSVGHSPLFHRTYQGLLFGSRQVLSPACYRCPYNRAAPERGSEARLTRQCGWECVGEVEQAPAEMGPTASAFVLEPRVQGAGSMSMHPHGYLQRVATLCRERGVWLFLDEVLTGFGRTGSMFAFQQEPGVVPDVVALAKGLTAGYLPLAATLASAEIFAAFLGEYAEFKTFFHGHSYSGNQLGCAVARASLGIFAREDTLATVQRRGAHLGKLAHRFWQHPHVGDVRREGMICAIELVQDFATRERFPAAARVGHRVCEAAKVYGLLTRPIGDVLVLMPPYCTTEAQLEQAVEALWRGLVEVLPTKGNAHCHCG